MAAWIGAAGIGACGGSGGGGANYEEYECPAPIGRIVREDCSKQALKYEGATFGGSVGVGQVQAGANYRDMAIREADGLVQLLKEQRVGVCNDFNTCKLSVQEYRSEVGRIDDSFVALLALKDRMAELDAEGAAKLLKEIRQIRLARGTSDGASAGSATMSCEGTSVDIGAKQYCLLRNRKTFYDAQKDCARMGGHLAVIDDEAEQTALYRKLGSPWGYGGGHWVDCTDAGSEGNWRCGEAPAAFIDWLQGQPDNWGGNEHCAGWLSDTGKINDYPCEVGGLAPLCEGDQSLKCRGKRFESAGRVYCAWSEQRNWESARQACAESGGKLAVIDSPQESQAVFDTLELPSAIPSWWNWEGVWIGFTDEAQEGAWRWVDGTPVRYGNWYGHWHEPNGGANENCATMPPSYGGGWVDVACGAMLPYLCEPN